MSFGEMGKREYEFFEGEVDKIRGGTVKGFAVDPDHFPIIIVEKDGKDYGIVISRDMEGNGRGHFDVGEVG